MIGVLVCKNHGMDDSDPFAEQLDSIEAGELVDTHVVYEVMDYMVTWPDRFHHPREDLIYARVAELVGQIGAKKWSCIAAQLPGRTGKQCRERWHNHLNPHISKVPWSEHEVRLL